MNGEVKRPLSVWVTQILVLFTLIPGIGLTILHVFSCFLPIGVSLCWSAKGLIEIGLASGFLIMLALALWGLQKRKKYGKWFGVIVLTIMAVGLILRSEYVQVISRSLLFGQPLPPPPYYGWKGLMEPYSYGYSSYSDLVTKAAFEIISRILFVLLIINLAFAKSVQRFFSKAKPLPKSPSKKNP
jgi:hypothetical protein